MIHNSKGTVFYGMHFYPGVAEYHPAGQDPFRVFLNEDTIRAMDPTFAGRPVFVYHPDEDVKADIDELRKEADGWVIESFFNAADGKHWAKFIIVSERGLRGIKRGMRLSNAYDPKVFGPGGLWNGVSYAKEVKGGEYEHLAIVPDPRYDESVILTPEEFKKYNEEKTLELQRIANSTKETSEMKFKFFKREKIENSLDIESMLVVLPKSGKEITITQLVNEADERLSNSPMAAHPESLVDMGEGSKMTVNDLLAKHKALCDELESMKKEKTENDDDMDEEEGMTNEEDESEKEKKMEAEKTKNELEQTAKDKAAADKAKADRLRNANKNPKVEAPDLELAEDQVARGKKRYG